MLPSLTMVPELTITRSSSFPAKLLPRGAVNRASAVTVSGAIAVALVVQCSLAGTTSQLPSAPATPLTHPHPSHDHSTPSGNGRPPTATRAAEQHLARIFPFRAVCRAFQRDQRTATRDLPPRCGLTMTPT